MNQGKIIEQLAGVLASVSGRDEQIVNDAEVAMHRLSVSIEDAAARIERALAPLERIARVVETLRAEVLSLSLQNVEKTLAEQKTEVTRAEQNDR
jgi:hypothetical protein